MFHIIASDLDGTLLSPSHQITEYTKKTLQILTKRGIHFVFATGRQYIDVAKIRDALNINAYTITSNGAKVHNYNGDVIFSCNIDEDIVSELFSVVYKDNEIITNIFRNDEWFINRKKNENENFFQGSKLEFNYKIYKIKKIPTDSICKVYFTCYNQKKLINLKNYLKIKWKDRINISFSLPICLEVISGFVSKGKALRKVSNLLGFDLIDCIAFGDGMNDQEMLQVVGKGCIMKNAIQQLKDKLPNLEIIGSNAEDAVSKYLHAMYLKN